MSLDLTMYVVASNSQILYDSTEAFKMSYIACIQPEYLCETNHEMLLVPL